MPNKENIGIDFDETLCEEVCYTPEEVLKATPRREFIEKVNKLYDQNFIVIYTARRHKLIPASLDWLDRNGVKYHAISNKKIPLFVYIDDKALHINDIDKLL